MKLPKYLPVLVMLGLTGSGAFAQLVTPNFRNYGSALGGNKADYQWTGFTAETRPAGVAASTSGLAGQWLAGIQSNGGGSNIVFSGTLAGSNDVTDFLSGSGFGGGIYTAGSETRFQISSSVPLTNMQSLVVQLYFGEGIAGPFAVTGTPSLTLATSNGPVTLAPTFSLVDSAMPATIVFPTLLDLVDYQWDLSGVTGTIQGYSVSWAGSMHTIFYGADSTESSAVHHENVLVPEPSATVATLGGIALLLMMRRFRRTVTA